MFKIVCNKAIELYLFKNTIDISIICCTVFWSLIITYIDHCKQLCIIINVLTFSYFISNAYKKKMMLGRQNLSSLLPVENGMLRFEQITSQYHLLSTQSNMP